MYTNIIKGDFRKLSRMAAIGTATASVLLAGIIPPTFAAPLAPSCVTIGDVYTTKEGIDRENIKITNNNCGKQVKVKVVLAFGADITCTPIGNNQARIFSWPAVPRRFDRLESC